MAKFKFPTNLTSDEVWRFMWNFEQRNVSNVTVYFLKFIYEQRANGLIYLNVNASW